MSFIVFQHHWKKSFYSLKKSYGKVFIRARNIQVPVLPFRYTCRSEPVPLIRVLTEPCTMRVLVEPCAIRISEESWAIWISVLMQVSATCYKYLHVILQILRVCVLQLFVVILIPFVIKILRN